MDAFGPHKRGLDPYDDPLGDGAKRQRMVVVEEASFSDDDDMVPSPVPIPTHYSPHPAAAHTYPNPSMPKGGHDRPGGSRYGAEYGEDRWLETKAVGTGRGGYEDREGRRYDAEWAANGAGRGWEAPRQGYRDSRPMGVAPRAGPDADWRDAYREKRDGVGWPQDRPPHPMDRPPQPMDRPPQPMNRPPKPMDRPPHPMDRPSHPMDAPPRPPMRPADSSPRMRASPLPPRQGDYEPNGRPSYASRSPGYAYTSGLQAPAHLSPPPPPAARSPTLQPGGPSPHPAAAYAPSPRAPVPAPAQRGWGAEPQDGWGGAARPRGREAVDDRFGPPPLPPQAPADRWAPSDMPPAPPRNPPAPRPHGPDGYPPTGYGAGPTLANPDSRQSDRAPRVDRWEAPADQRRPLPAAMRAAAGPDGEHGRRRSADPPAALPPGLPEDPPQARGPPGPPGRAAGGSDRPASTDTAPAAPPRRKPPPPAPQVSAPAPKAATQTSRRQPRRQAATKEEPAVEAASASDSSAPSSPAPTKTTAPKPPPRKRTKARRKDPAQERAARAARRGQPSPDIPEASPTVGAVEGDDESEDEGPSLEVQQQQLAYLRDVLLPALVASPAAEWFRSPVDPVALDIPHYLDVIKHPMDLGTVQAKLQAKLQAGAYAHPDVAISEVLLVFNNCRTFNPPGHAILPLVSKLETLFNAKIKALPMGEGRPHYRRQFCPHCGEMRSADSFIQHRTLFARQDGDWDRAQKPPA